MCIAILGHSYSAFWYFYAWASLYIEWLDTKAWAIFNMWIDAFKAWAPFNKWYNVKRGSPHLKSIFINKTNTGQFAMSHGSYDLKLDSEIFILAGQQVGSISVGHTVWSIEIVPRGGPPLKIGGPSLEIINLQPKKGGSWIHQPKGGGISSTYSLQKGVRL